MALAYSLAYNAVVLPVTPASAAGGQRFQISASRNDREAPRYISPPWSEPEVRAAFAAAGITGLEYQELRRGNRRATGGRYPQRLDFAEEQLQQMGLYRDPTLFALYGIAPEPPSDRIEPPSAADTTKQV